MYLWCIFYVSLVYLLCIFKKCKYALYQVFNDKIVYVFKKYTYISKIILDKTLNGDEVPSVSSFLL